ncbi:MAG: phosphoglucosamine mutase [Candidatus Thorarchaeota archaeon]|nr:phosphoglucosamine mutase [Candidatus Thorarchaeota archaeon]
MNRIVIPVTEKLFGTTGVRKIYGEEFDLEMALNLGKALGTHLGKGTVLLARDARITGLMVANALTSGLVSTGIDVIDAGIIPTPTLAFITMKQKFDAGIMVTASHNPPEYTGVKFWSRNSMGFTQGEERELEKIYDSKQFNVARWDELGKVSHNESAVDEHIDALLEMCDVDTIRSKSFRVVVDPGNGAACLLTPYLMQRLNCQVVTINGQLDGHFPGRRSEPDEDSLGDLIQMIKKTGAALGIAHDGDADRIVFVTEKGEVVRGDRTIALLAQQALSTSKSKTVVTTVDSSLVLDETVERAGGNTIRTPVGDIQVAVKVVESKGVIGGEACGVFIFPDAHLAPEPFLAACKVLELMARTGKSFGELVTTIPQYPLLKSKIACPNDKKESVMSKIATVLPEKVGDVKEVLTVDGLGITSNQGWVLVRPSGTEPVIRITCEGQSKNAVEKILKITEEVVSSTVASA